MDLPRVENNEIIDRSLAGLKRKRIWLGSGGKQSKKVRKERKRDHWW